MESDMKKFSHFVHASLVLLMRSMLGRVDACVGAFDDRLTGDRDLEPRVGLPNKANEDIRQVKRSQIKIQSIAW